MNNSICTLFDNILIDIHKFKSLRYKQANDVTKKLVDKAAEDLIAEMKSNQGKDIKKEPHHH